MSFRDFKDDLLLALAFVSEAKPTIQVDPLEAANARNLKFREGWLRQAVNALNDEGLIKARFFLGGDENRGMRCSLTGAGLQEAEEIASRTGYDLYGELDRISSSSKISSSEPKPIPASDRIVQIDHNAPEFLDIKDKLERTILATRQSNSLREDMAAAEQHIAELEAGKVILSASQADKTLVERLLLPALKWLLEKIADNVVSILITTLITLIAAYFGLIL